MLLTPAIAAILLALPRLHTPQPVAAPEGPEAHATPARLEESLPSHPGLFDRRLANGLRVVAMRQANPPGRAEVWLHVATGSLSEAENHSGLAHFVEHMAFEGSDSFPPGSHAAFFESLGMVPQAHAFSSTGFDQTVYQFTLPDVQPATFDTVMLFLADVGARLTFPEEGIEAVRTVVIDERRRGISAERQVTDTVLERLTPGSLLASRPIAGADRALALMTRRDIVEHYSRWYVPALMTLVVVGDADPAMVAARAEEAFGALPSRAAPVAPDPRIAPTRGVSAVVLTDPTLSAARVALSRVGPVPQPVVAVGAWREQLVRRVAVGAFNRRLTELIALSNSPVREARAQFGQVGRVVHRAEIEASGSASAWDRILTDVLDELSRAREHGFTSAELARARDRALDGAKRTAATEHARPAPQMARLITDATTSGEPFMSAAQELDLGTRLLSTISDEEINLAFKDFLDPTNLAVVITLPVGTPTISEADVLSKLGVATTAPAPPPAPRAGILTELPADGEISERATHVGSSVHTLRLANGAVVHHRLMEHRHEIVTITVTLPGGEIQETSDTRGVTRAAAEAFRVPATASRSAEQVQSTLAERGVTFATSVSADAVTLTVTALPENIEAGFQLLYALLTGARLSDTAVDEWKARQARALLAMQRDLSGVFAAALPDIIYPPADARPRPLTAEQVVAITPDSARARLSELIRGGLEVSVVGKIDQDRAVTLTRRYLASLPTRPRIEPGSLDALRSLEPPRGDRAERRTVPGDAQGARVMTGFFGPDAGDVKATRLAGLAARVLTSRLLNDLRDRRALVPSLTVSVAPATAYPGYGVIYAAAPCSADHADTVADTMAGAFSEFAASGPTPDEMKKLRREVSESSTIELVEPEFWTRTLRDLNYRATRLDDVVEAPAALLEYSAAEIKDAFARFHTTGPALRLVVVSTPPAGSTR